MIINFGDNFSILSEFVSELRDIQIQGDRQRFRRNLERIGEAAALEISRKLPHISKEVQTPLGRATCKVLAEQPIAATILRAGLPMLQGMLNYFDRADSAFISAFRKHKHDGSFGIELEYCSCPPIKDRILIVCDPMLATGSSMVATLKALFKEGLPKQIHIVAAIAAKPGVEKVRTEIPQAFVWAGAIDPELDSRAYIVPGLGDAGDLAYGNKVQS